MLLLVLAVFIAGGIASALDLKFITGGKPRTAIANSLYVLNAQTLDTIRNTPGRQAPRHPVVARGAGLLWTVNRDDNRLVATAPESGRVVRNVVVGTGPVSVATGFGSAWVANAENGSITRVALAGRKVETIGLNDQPAVVATGSGYVWVISPRSKKLLRIDPKTNTVKGTVRFTEPPVDVTARDGRVLLSIGH